MASLAMYELDAYSRIAVPLVLSRFPDWERYATTRPRLDGAGCVVRFEVPCPSPRPEAGLWVWTDDEELTVGFHTHHCHFTDYEDRAAKCQMEAGLEHAVAIVGDRVGVLSYYRGDTFTGSRTVDLPLLGPMPGLFDGFAAVMIPADATPDPGRVTLRSWSGRFDRDAS